MKNAVDATAERNTAFKTSCFNHSIDHMATLRKRLIETVQTNRRAFRIK